MPFAEFFAGLLQAVQEAPKRHGVSAGLIMCILRDLGPEAAEELLQQAEPYREHIGALGLDSAERGWPPRLYTAAYRRAAELGWHRVAHAGGACGRGGLTGHRPAMASRRPHCLLPLAQARRAALTTFGARYGT